MVCFGVVFGEDFMLWYCRSVNKVVVVVVINIIRFINGVKNIMDDIFGFNDDKNK